MYLQRVLISKLPDISYALGAPWPNDDIKRLGCISLWKNLNASQCQKVVDVVREYCSPLSLAYLSIFDDEHLSEEAEGITREPPFNIECGDSVDLSHPVFLPEVRILEYPISR